MKRNDYLYPSGEFARLTGVNKRTLHYYNDIGLFCPEIIGENGYHYYSCFQFAQLELILTLRKIGLSIEEIREYVTGPSDESFSRMMEKKKQLIDASIRQLLSVQAFLEQKSQRLQQALRRGMERLSCVRFRRERLSVPLRFPESTMKRIFPLRQNFPFA